MRFKNVLIPLQLNPTDRLGHALELLTHGLHHVLSRTPGPTRLQPEQPTVRKVHVVTLGTVEVEVLVEHVHTGP